MNRKTVSVGVNVRVQSTTSTGSSVSSVPTPEDIANASMRRLRAEIETRFGSVKAFAPLTSMSAYGLNDNLAGRTDMKLKVLYEILALLELDQAEFARRVLADLEAPQP